MRRFLSIIKQWLVFYRETISDGRRFLAAVPWAGAKGSHRVRHLEGDIVRRYHVIEKGLAMPDFRPKAGLSMVKALIEDLNSWRDSGPISPQACSENQIAAAEAVLRAYRDRHVALGVDLEGLLDAINLSGTSESGTGGVRVYEPVSSEMATIFEAFARSRASVRTFIPDKIPPRELILKAVATAGRAPSVCNRQTARVHVYEGEQIQTLLEFQNGNRGFGHRTPLLMAVTSDLRYFTGTEERYQSWIDGGMFAMQLLLALHSLGLGAVPLNWSVFNSRDRALRSAGDIPDYERVIMLIGCGWPEEGAVVPFSQRRPVEEITFFH